MKILIISVGKKNDSSMNEAVTDFTARISHYAPIEWKLISPSESIEMESKAVTASLSERDYVVLLDEKGKAVSSKGLAELLEKRLNESTHRLVFIIGGAYGVNEEVRSKADSTIALSSMTFPHQLVRLIISEQIYRAFSILKGEKYHHE